MKRAIIFCLAIALMLGIFQEAVATVSKSETDEMHFQEIKIALTGTSTTETKADYFAGKSARSVILAPGAMFSKESWHFLAERFLELGISSVALNSGSTPDLLNAVAFLKAKGAKKITIIGASAGGAGVLFTLKVNIDPLVDSVILLAPAGGLPIKSEQVKKLFIVAEDDMISSNAEVYKLYINSSDPKLYEEITGSSDHAQHLFDSKHKEDIIQLMIDFIEN
jgi:pimeloyl-ACP methyl ester carboxylesterase